MNNINQVYYPIAPRLGIVGQEISADATSVEVPVSSNKFFICDDSGSMWGEMREVRTTVKNQMRSLNPGDTLTIARFSSANGDYDFFVKGLLITSTTDFAAIDKLIDKNLTGSSMTCYTEVLQETKNVIAEIQKISTNTAFSLAFLSDGMPNQKASHSEIFDAIDAIKGSINQSFIIGYGRYYNKTLLNDMASRLGATLLHNETGDDFNMSFTQFITNKPAGKNVKVKVQTVSDTMFYLTPKGEVVRVITDENGEFLYPMSKMSNIVYTIVADTLLPISDTTTENAIRAYYAAALVLDQSLRTYDALQTLSLIGDKFLVDQLAKAFTVSQFGVAESLINAAISNKNARFLSGKHVNCLPDENAFCFLDLVELLQEDDSLMMYPNDTRFNYKRIGRQSVNNANEKEFLENKNDGYKINNIILNQTRPNVSLQIIKEGKVKLAEPGTQEYRDRENINAKNRKNGLETIPNQFETFVFRNYTVVSDGDYNITRLPISMSEDTYNKLKAVGLIGANERYGKTKIFLLEIKNLPIISRRFANRDFTAKAMAEQFTSIQLQKIDLSTTKYFLNSVKPLAAEGPNEFEVKYGVEGAALLKSLNITPKMGFSPKSVDEKPNDYYMAKEFKITMGGFSTISIPKYLEKKAKIEEWNKNPKGKQPTYTTVESVIDGYYTELLALSGGTIEEVVAKVETRLKNLKEVLKESENELNYEKIAMLLTNSSFSDVTERGEVNVDVNHNKTDYSVKLDLKETTVYF